MERCVTLSGPNILDRAYPALILVSPVVVAAVATFPVTPSQGHVGNGLTVTVLIAAFYALKQLVRSAGRSAEKRLWDSWGGPPSTRFMLWSDQTFSDEWKRIAHKVVEKAVSIRLLSADEEKQDEKKARKLLFDAFMQVRTALDLKLPKWRLRTHNAEYGFARNLLGGCPAGMWLAGAATLWCLVFWGVRQTTSPGMGALGCIILLVGFGVAKELWLPSLAKITADRYAEKAWTAFVELNRDAEAVSKETSG